MKKCLLITLTLSLFIGISCSDQYEGNIILDKNIEEVENFKFSEQIEFFSHDSLNSAIVILYSDDSLLFETYKRRLNMFTEDFDVITYSNINTSDENDVTSHSEKKRYIRIEVLSINTELSTVGFGLREENNLLKAQLPWKYTTEYVVTEKEWPFQYAKYIHVPSDTYGISVEFGYKDCWLCGWKYPLSYEYHLHTLEENNTVLPHPKNNVSSVWRLATRFVSNLSDKSNFYWWVSKESI